ncbi:MAG: glutamate decarboxylase [Candidatus Nanopelagicales bacterium]|jgi:glutamate decarboxylase|nr:glutamate decarboxylase [Candidatus Nanopelagicales bacterium]
MPLHRTEVLELERLAIAPVYARPGATTGIPKDRLPDDGMDPRVAYRLIHDELMLDGNARQNVATFVTTFMEPEAEALFAETADKNMIDKDEYPQTAAIEGRCVRIISELWHSPAHEQATGCSTTGSSEAVMLGGLALKWRWRQRREAAGLPTDRPNLVMGINVQVVWEKFCRYWDVEPRYAPIEEGRLQLDAEEALKLVDERTIGVVAILGSTFDGSYEPVKEISAALDERAASGGPDVPIHVDGASGGFVAPFIDPELEWDFRVPRVRSINASGHKYGLVYPGVGWVVWRTPEDLPEDLVFHVNYLGGDMPTFALNFSRPGAQVIAQYYNFIRLGREGYREVQQACRDTAMYLADQIADMGPYELLSDGSQLPVFFFRLKPEVTNYTVYDVSAKLRERGWQVPAYSLPDNLTDVSGLRIVVRNGFGRDLADLLLDDLRRATDFLEHLPGRLPADPSHTESFRH